MKKILLTALIISIVPLYAMAEGGIQNISYGTRPNGTNFQNFHNHHGFRPNIYHQPRLNGRYRHGALTGFTPSLIPYYNSGIYGYSDGITNRFYSTNSNWQGVKNWWANLRNQNSFPQNYYFQYNPYLNGNYNTNANQKGIQLFNSNSNGINYIDPNDSNGANIGSTVTIIE